jgi:hypothetical protein
MRELFARNGQVAAVPDWDGCGYRSYGCAPDDF